MNEALHDEEEKEANEKENYEYLKWVCENIEK